MQQVTTIKELKEVLNSNQEMVVRKSTKDNVIVMSMEEYRKIFFDEEIEKHLLKSEEDIKMGRTKNAREVFKELEEKYGF